MFFATFIYYNSHVTVTPTNVMAMVLTPRSVMVTWTPSHPITNVTMYIIHYITTVSYTDSGNMTVNGINTTTGILPDLEENTPYTITVQAVSYRGGMVLLSGFSNEVPVVTFTDGK